MTRCRLNKCSVVTVMSSKLKPPQFHNSQKYMLRVTKTETERDRERGEQIVKEREREKEREVKGGENTKREHGGRRKNTLSISKSCNTLWPINIYVPCCCGCCSCCCCYTRSSCCCCCCWHCCGSSGRFKSPCSKYFGSKMQAQLTSPVNEFQIGSHSIPHTYTHTYTHTHTGRQTGTHMWAHLLNSR